MPRDPMPVTKAQLADRIGTSVDKVDHAFDLAVEKLDEALEDAFRPMPDHTYAECVLSIGYAVWDRKKSSAGSKQTTTMEGQIAVRAPRDPLASIRPLLANYVLTFA